MSVVDNLNLLFPLEIVIAFYLPNFELIDIFLGQGCLQVSLVEIGVMLKDFLEVVCILEVATHLYCYQRYLQIYRGPVALTSRG